MKEIIQAMRKRNSLLRGTNKSGSDVTLRKYIAERNQVVSLLWTTKATYFQKLGSYNSKEFWKAVKLVSKRCSSIPALKDGSSLITTDHGKAQLLNDFFHSCFNHSCDLLSSPDPIEPSNCPSDLGCLLALYGSTMHPARLCGGFRTFFFLLLSMWAPWEKKRRFKCGWFGITWGHNVYTGAQNGAKLEIRPERILIHTLELSFPVICLYRETIHLQCFPSMRYVRGGATCTHKGDDLYPIWSKLEYRLPACIVWLY